jgi:UDP-3-O-[3-hydroxymyristoyl] glucosamine N-acyltransferase
MEKSYTLKTLAQLLNCDYFGDPNKAVTGFDDLKTATGNEVSFLANSRYQEAMKQSQAGIICVCPSTEKQEHQNYLMSEDPSFAFQQVINLFFDRQNQASGFFGIHPSAAIHPSAKISQGVKIGPFVSIDQGVEIAEGTTIVSHVSIGAGVKIGKNCLIHPQVTIREGCILQERVILQPGVVIGSCGYGYQTTKEKTHVKLEQIGIVILEDDVEIGANTTIDRARFKATIIKCGTKIDNLVQIGHNVEVGRHSLIVSQTGIAGSTKVGDHVIMGGQCGIVGHIEIAPHTILTTRSGVSKSIDKAAIYGGSPIMPLNDYNRQQVLLRNIDTLNKKIKNIEDKLSELKDLSKT